MNKQEKEAFDQFLQHEGERERRRQQQKRMREAQAELERERRALDAKSAADKKQAQHALKNRIMSDAQARWEEGNKKKYDLAQPLSAPEPWLVFDRVTREFYGEAVAMRAFQAWSEVNPTKLVQDPAKPERLFSIAVGFNACKCVLRSEWEKSEEVLRAKRSNGKSNGANG